MPVYQLEQLLGATPSDAALLRLFGMLHQGPPGILLATGQASSGKLTALLAMAEALRAGEAVHVLAGSPGELDTFHPLPAGWTVEEVAPGEAAWREAAARDFGAAVVVIPSLHRANAAAVWQGAHRGWVLATVDTPLLGSDVASVLVEMGVSADVFLERVRCIWSQFLIQRICPACAEPAALDKAELDDLLPGGAAGGRLLSAPGCASCGGTGSAEGRLAASEALLVTPASIASIRRAVEDGEAVAPDERWHVTVHDQARRMLLDGGISVTTYRDAVRRNPLLRAQNRLEREQARSHRLSGMFEKFVSPEVKQRLIESGSLDEVARGETREVTCMFCDIRGFTSRAEKAEAEALFADLNAYFAEVVDCVLAHEGTIDKFIGDALMVVWGAPVDQPDHAQRAVACALGVRERVARFNVARTGPPFEIGIGINTGMAAAGCVGTDRRMEYTVLGDVINTAARLESVARPGQVVASEATRVGAGPSFRYGPAQQFQLKGKAEAVTAYEVLANTSSS